MEWKEPKEIVEFAEVKIQPTDLHLDRVLPLVNLDRVMSGEITGEIAIKGNLSDLDGGGDLFLNEGKIGKENIEKFELNLELDQERANIMIDSDIGDEGVIALNAMVPFDEGKDLRYYSRYV